MADFYNRSTSQWLPSSNSALYVERDGNGDIVQLTGQEHMMMLPDMSAVRDIPRAYWKPNPDNSNAIAEMTSGEKAAVEAARPVDPDE